MTDPGPRATMEDMEEFLTQILNYVQNTRNADGASSLNQGNDKKTPRKKQKPVNKQLENLKKKIAKDKAQLAQARKDLKNKMLSETLEKAEKELEKKKERVRSLKEKLNESTGQ